MVQSVTPPPGTDSSETTGTNAQFTVAMRNFNGLLRTNSLKQALVWAGQTALIAQASNNDEEKSAAREAYVGFILVCAAKFEGLALHCGNITTSHVTIAEVLNEAVDRLVEHARTSSANLPLMVALMLQGFSSTLRERVLRIAQDDFPSSAAMVDEVMYYIDQIVDGAARLTEVPQLYQLTPEECIITSCDALSNASYELNWLLPSDWAKATFYCTRALRLLSIDSLPPDRPGLLPSTPARAIIPMLQPVVDSLPELIKTLGTKEYRVSKRRLKEMNAIFEKLRNN